MGCEGEVTSGSRAPWRFVWWEDSLEAGDPQGHCPTSGERTVSWGGVWPGALVEKRGYVVGYRGIWWPRELMKDLGQVITSPF